MALLVRSVSVGRTGGNLRAFFASTVGRKLVVAVTGVVLFGFVVAHMLGNLTVYLGARSMNDYAAFLHSMLHGTGIWVARAVLLAAVLAHAWGIWSLTLTNRRARSKAYRVLRPRVSTFASRSMRWSGALLIAFIVFHLLHLTTGTLHPNFIAGDPFHNVTRGLKVVLSHTLEGPVGLAALAHVALAASASSHRALWGAQGLAPWEGCERFRVEGTDEPIALPYYIGRSRLLRPSSPGLGLG